MTSLCGCQICMNMHTSEQKQSVIHPRLKPGCKIASEAFLHWTTASTWSTACLPPAALPRVSGVDEEQREPQKNPTRSVNALTCAGAHANRSSLLHIEQSGRQINSGSISMRWRANQSRAGSGGSLKIVSAAPLCSAAFLLSAVDFFPPDIFLFSGRWQEVNSRATDGGNNRPRDVTLSYWPLKDRKEKV